MYLIIGLGKTGFSCVRYLRAKGLPCLVCDTREQPPYWVALRAEYPEVDFVVGLPSAAALARVSECLISPGVPPQAAWLRGLQAYSLPMTNDIGFFLRELSVKQSTAKCIGITGANGKSTVTQLVYEMACCAQVSVAVGGNIGTPVLDLLQAPLCDYYVLEISSFQLEQAIDWPLETAVVLNIAEDHLDRHGDLATYRQIKERIYQQCSHPVVEANQWVQGISFGLGHPAEGHWGVRVNAQGAPCLAYGRHCVLPIALLKIVGEHNVLNALAALALGQAAGLSIAAMRAALLTFSGLAHRCQWVGEYQGVSWYNDSKATNVAAALAAINGVGHRIAGKLVLILGGIGKHQEFMPLRSALQHHARAVVLLGHIDASLRQAMPAGLVTPLAKSMAEAVEYAAKLAERGDAVLLSPACASFDLFSSFVDRGEQFMTCVMHQVAA